MNKMSIKIDRDPDEMVRTVADLQEIRRQLEEAVQNLSLSCEEAWDMMTNDSARSAIITVQDYSNQMMKDIENLDELLKMIVRSAVYLRESENIDNIREC